MKNKILELFRAYKAEIEKSDSLHKVASLTIIKLRELLRDVDPLKIRTFSDFPAGFEELLSKRKNFISGDSSSLTNITSGGAILSLGQLSHIGLVHVTKYRKPIQGNGYYGAEGTILLNFIEEYYILGNDTVWEIGNELYYQNPQFNSGIPVKVTSLSGSPRARVNEITRIIRRVIERNELEISFYPDDSFKNNLKWIAYER